MCYFSNIHNKHKILRIDDEKAFKKQNISIEGSTKDFLENKTKIEETKNKIENEIIELNKSYDKVDKEVTESYKLKHEKLINEENNLKDKLKTKVTKIKENLEINLSKINEIIKKNERIIKGLKLFLEEKDKQMIKILNYVSNINKNIKETKLYSQQPMKNIKIIYNEKENNIIYDEYYFNGTAMPVPKDIIFNDIEKNSFKISWEIDDINIINIDYKEVKYKVEIRKENEQFKLSYEGNNNNCIINNLDSGTYYEIRICLFYNKIFSNWSKIYKIKTFIDSLILNNYGRKQEYINKLFEWSGYKSMELIYRGTRDGMTSKDFHNKCDNKGKTICLFLNDNYNIFGGYSSIPWTSNGGEKTANDCFIFTLTNNYNTEPTKFPFVKGRSVYHGPSNGPCFGNGPDLGFYTIFNNNSNRSFFPSSYQDILGKENSIFTGNYNNNNFKLKEIEIFKLS